MEDTGRLVMQLTQHPEHEWSKGDTLAALDLDTENKLSGQIHATAFLFRAGAINVAFTDEWLKTCVSGNYHLVDDTPSYQPNSPTFQDHRHDQAIFSGLIKKYGAHVIQDETFWAPHWEILGNAFPIWAPRNRSRVSILDHSLNGSILRFSERLYSKVYRDTMARSYSGRSSRR
jgi:hypothetical protein